MPAHAPLPAELQTREQWSAAYDNVAAVADVATLLAGLRERSESFHAGHACHADQPYGPKPRQVYDWYPPAHGDAAGAAVLVYVHGGYWQARSKRDFACVAAGAHAAGMHVVLAEYTLAPEAGIGDMVAEIGRLLDLLAAHPVLGSAATGAARIVLSGHSAGGQLAAMHRAHSAVRAVLAISGLFELEPIRRGALNDALRLDDAQVHACSPQRHIGAGVPTLVAVGDAELPELQRQSREYAAALQAAGQPAQLLELPGANHFTVLDPLERDDGVLLAEALRLAGHRAR